MTRKLREDTYTIVDEKFDKLDLINSPSGKQRPLTKMLKKFVARQVGVVSSSESEEELEGDRDEVAQLPPPVAPTNADGPKKKLSLLERLVAAQAVGPTPGGSAPPGDIERQVKKVLDQPQFKQMAVFAREAHESIGK